MRKTLYDFYNYVMDHHEGELREWQIDEFLIQLDLITETFLLESHPELSPEEAANLREFLVDNTITHKECYGDGSIMYPKWKEHVSTN